MAEGAFIVSQDEKDKKQIRFQTKADGNPAPDEQLDLKTEIERTLLVLQMLLENDEKKYFQYFLPLLSLAQCGLVGSAAQPAVARQALTALRDEVVAREAGNVKNRYLKSLGKQAAIFASCPALVFAAHYFFGITTPYSNFLLMWCGCMVGVWLSFGSRKVVFKFEDLHIPEQDRLEPAIRLIFAGLLTLTLGLVFTREMVVVTIGKVMTSQIGTDRVVALLMGIFCGVSELALPSKIRKQAEAILKDR